MGSVCVGSVCVGSVCVCVHAILKGQTSAIIINNVC